MIKTKSSLELKAGERLYQFICESDSPLTEAIEILSLMKDHTQQLLDNAINQARAADEKTEEQIIEGEECVVLAKNHKIESL